MYLHFGCIYSEMGKETSSHLEIISFIYKQKKEWNEMKTKPCIEWWDEDEWDENETLHLIMMMVKKNYTLENYLQKNYLHKKKQINKN